MGELVRVSSWRAAGRQERGSWLRRNWWWLWSRCPGLGITRLRQLASCCPDPAVAWSLSPEELADRLGWPPALLHAVEAHRRRWGADPIPARSPRGHLHDLPPRCLLPGDPALPPAIGRLQRPPLALFWQGRGSLWPLLRRRMGVAVVGTRHPSAYGLSVARAIGRALGEAGWPVVSGLAEGIDGAAHQGCLQGGGRPVAVLGTPLGRAYPRHHAALQEAVAADGLLITEQPAGARVQPGHFAARNRLLVALSRAVVVVECPARSGALHSARLAWGQELPLWVVPADLGRPSAAGSNALLAQGASALLDPRTLVDHLGPGPLARSPGAGGEGAPEHRGPSTRSVLAALGHGAALEELSRRLQQPVGEVSLRLLELELAGEVVAYPGLRWGPA